MAESPSRVATRTSRVPSTLLALSLSYVALLGVASRDYGDHWDEPSILRTVQKSVETGSLLPGWYNYPSVTYDVGMLAAVRRVATGAARWSGRAATPPDTAGVFVAREFRLELRSIFFLLCTLTGLGVYLLTRRLTGSGWAALFAALAVVASWEFTYHARWIAPDGLVMLFTPFSLWAQHRILGAPPGAERRRAIALAAVFAGLAAGAKYQGGILAVPLLIAILRPARVAARGAARPQRSSTMREVALALLILVATFVLTTPGCLLQSAQFVSDVEGEMAHYGFGHGGHTVIAGWPHFSLLAIYFGTVMLSRSMVLAVLSMALALTGAVSLARSRPGEALWLLSLPVLFIGYISMQRVMIVRNVLFMLPVLGALAGVGIAALWSAARGRVPLAMAIRTAALVIVAFNLTVATRSAWSIVHPNPVTRKRALERRIASAPGVRFYLSPVCRELIAAPPPSHPANVVDSLASADRVIFASDEIQDWREFVANRPGRYRTVWKKVDEVNWDYYPDWSGTPRLLEVSTRLVQMR